RATGRCYNVRNSLPHPPFRPTPVLDLIPAGALAAPLPVIASGDVIARIEARLGRMDFGRDQSLEACRARAEDAIYAAKRLVASLSNTRIVGESASLFRSV